MPDPPYRVAGVEWVIFDLLLERSSRSWGVGELVDAIGSPIAVAEALEALQAAGLIERRDAFVRIAPP
jgi:DNA-binding transcriptional ArsR family regulator